MLREELGNWTLWFVFRIKSLHRAKEVQFSATYLAINTILFHQAILYLLRK